LDETDPGLVYPGGTTSGGDDDLVERNALDQLSVLDGTADLLDDTDIAQVNVRRDGAEEAGDGGDGDRSEDGGVLRDDLNGQLRQDDVSSLAYLGVERCGSSTHQRFPVVHVHRYRDVIEQLYGLGSGLLEGVGDGGGVDACFVSSTQSEIGGGIIRSPCERSFSAAPSRLPARTTTLVVPSPASISCACDNSTSYRVSSAYHAVEEHELTIRAAGCKTAICLRIVAPSLVMTTSPVLVWI
jgi:hypothetical protein